jgi:glycosyltransferase involved in cell wall biosynthesis
VSTATPLLIVSYWFAPHAAVGARRFSFLAREFTRLGYDVHVITNRTDDANAAGADHSLPSCGQVHHCAAPVNLPLAGPGITRRAGNALLRRLLAPVGWQAPWAGAATRKALEVARALPPGVVIATSPACAAFIAGARVAQRLGWPLILDYRDPWSAHDWPRWRRGRIAQLCARLVEEGVLTRAAARVLNTPAMRASFERFFPQLDPALNFVIPNGFDPPEDDPQRAPTPAPDGALEIVHAGEIFTGRSLLPVLEAARRVASRQPRPVRIVTHGEVPPAERQRIRAARLEGLLEVRPRMPFDQLFSRLRRAHLLLAVVGEHMLYSTPYKVYDYMATGRPILGIAPRGAALFDLLAESGAGVCIDRDDIDAIEGALAAALVDPLPGPGARVDRFRWSNLAQQYRAVIESVHRDRRRSTATPSMAGGAIDA